MGRSCSQNGGRSECFQNLTGKPIGNRPLGKPKRRWKDNIRIDFKINRYQCG